MDGKYTLIRCGLLYDGVTEEWKKDQQILVEDDRIVAVGTAVPAPEGTREIDLSAYQVTPGLIDAHMHMDFLDWHTIREEVYSTSEEAKTLAIARCAKKALLRGFTTVRHVGGITSKGYGVLDVKRAIAAGYLEGYLRCSVVSDPLERVNTGNNTPAVLHLDLVPGEQIRIDVCPKGFGSENMSAVRMFTPAASAEDIVGFVVDTIAKAGSNPCPPIVVGVGIGGDFEQCALLAKKALCRDVAVRNPKPLYAELEQKMLDAVNRLGIGPQGFGGTVTALAVNIEQGATHIAGLPVAVNVGCHVTRHASMVL